LSIMIDF